MEDGAANNVGHDTGPATYLTFFILLRCSSATHFHRMESHARPSLIVMPKLHARGPEHEIDICYKFNCTTAPRQGFGWLGRDEKEKLSEHSEWVTAHLTRASRHTEILSSSDKGKASIRCSVES